MNSEIVLRPATGRNALGGKRGRLAAAVVTLFVLVLSTPGAAAATGDPNPNDGVTTVDCADSDLIVSISIIWRGGADMFTTIGVVPSKQAREAFIGTGGQLVEEFLACMSRTAESGATVYARTNRLFPYVKPGSWGSGSARLGWHILPSTGVFAPDSDDRHEWQTFTDQLQCHDGAPGLWERTERDDEGNYDLGGNMWDLEGRRTPTGNKVIWFLTSCNW